MIKYKHVWSNHRLGKYCLICGIKKRNVEDNGCYKYNFDKERKKILYWLLIFTIFLIIIIILDNVSTYNITF